MSRTTTARVVSAGGHVFTSVVVRPLGARIAAILAGVLRTLPRDHYLGGEFNAADSASFGRLQSVLRVADKWPSGTTGTQVRRAACDLIESSSRWGRAMARRRLRACVARVQWRRAHGRVLPGDPAVPLVDELTDALLREGNSTRGADVSAAAGSSAAPARSVFQDLSDVIRHAGRRRVP